MKKFNPDVNNAFYDQLNDKWWEASDHPIALLRAENQIRNPWISDMIKTHCGSPVKVLDIGCGGGLLTTHLAMHNHIVTGIDTSQSSLDIARAKDPSGNITYLQSCAMNLPFEKNCFDVVTAMDLLEHVPCYKSVIKEASKTLKKDGLFFFHTFNRNFLSYVMIIKGVEWFVKNTPENMHVYDKFITPKELKNTLHEHNLEIMSLQGLIPDFTSKGLWKMLICKKVDSDFRFKFVKNTLTGYVGIAKKKS